MQTARKSFTAIVVSALMLTLVANLTACGTILHPERRGQRGGNIDAGIAVLDAVGLLFFIIPGVIAFAVDFSNGTIYLPHGHSSSMDDPHKYSEIHFNNKLDVSMVESYVSARSGTRIDLHQSNVEVVKLESVSDLDAEFALYAPDTRVAMAH
jgi:hypothetical protein